MKYMLDTNICIYLIKKKPRHVIDNLSKITIAEICISSITLSELEYGVEKSQRKEQNKMALVEFLAPVEILAFDETAARHCGRIRAELESRGQPIGSFDLLIAAHAISLDLILVTNNESEFKRVSGLKIENWV
jgi:tRNA(fMet)-specific endonuclease VapC